MTKKTNIVINLDNMLTFVVVFMLTYMTNMTKTSCQGMTHVTMR
jgi:hypothetical protein